MNTMEQLTSLLKKEHNLLVKDNTDFEVSSEIKGLLDRVNAELADDKTSKEVLEKLKREYTNLETVENKAEREDLLSRFLHFVQLLVVHAKKENYKCSEMLKDWYDEQANNLVGYKSLNASEISGV